MSWFRQHPDATLTLSIYTQPGAKRTEFAGCHADALKVRIAAPAIDGKANACLLAFIADYCAIAKNKISFVRGETSRQKVLRISQADSALIEKLTKLA